jgi:hypothetical protein
MGAAPSGAVRSERLPLACVPDSSEEPSPIPRLASAVLTTSLSTADTVNSIGAVLDMVPNYAE